MFPVILLIFSRYLHMTGVCGAGWCPEDGGDGQPRPPHLSEGDGVSEGSLRALWQGQGWWDQHWGARQGKCHVVLGSDSDSNVLCCTVIIPGCDSDRIFQLFPIILHLPLRYPHLYSGLSLSCPLWQGRASSQSQPPPAVQSALALHKRGWAKTFWKLFLHFAVFHSKASNPSYDILTSSYIRYFRDNFSGAVFSRR